MAGPGVFHVEFGINETSLTQALENDDYEAATKIILENYNASYLDEGCYQRTPLYITLSGLNQEETAPAPRNLHFAKLLIENGANVNYRVPITEFGSEYVGPGKTAFELVVDFYNTITRHESHTEPGSEERQLCSWDPTQYYVIGLDNQRLLQYEDIIEHLVDLTFLMLNYGADVSITDERRMTPLHRTAFLSKDISLLQLLTQYTHDPNPLDIRESTPLIGLCDGFPCGIQQFLEDWPTANPYTNCCNLNGKEIFLKHLLSLKGIKIDAQSRFGRSALFNCMVRGDLYSAVRLLQCGADPTLRGQLLVGGNQSREVSPLFAALASLRVLHHHTDRYRPYDPHGYQFLAHLVDAGYFTRSKITSELFEFIDSDFPDLQQVKALGTQLIHLMFGGTTASLRQLCTRTIFKICLSNTPALNDTVLEKNMTLQCWDSTNYDHPEIYQAYGTRTLNCLTLERLLTTLNLPRDSCIYFQVELLRLRLCSMVKQYQWFKYYDGEIDGAYGNWSDSDELPTDEDDSDLEYW